MTGNEETFALAREGDAEAYREVVLAHHAPLYRWVAAELLDPEAARAIVEDLFVRGWERLRSFPREDAFVAWVFRTARTLAAERTRARRRGAARHSASQWREEPFNVALAVLPEGQRAALVLREWGGLPYEEIAVRLGASEAAVRSRLSLAREAILRRL
ncbi:MAG: RNA polymerase sigma factor [Candidatus Coatesbacteria bacterium]